LKSIQKKDQGGLPRGQRASKGNWPGKGERRKGRRRPEKFGKRGGWAEEKHNGRDGKEESSVHGLAPWPLNDAGFHDIDIVGLRRCKSYEKKEEPLAKKSLSHSRREWTL